MAQLVTRIDADLARLVDELVEEGVVDSRSDAVRRGLGMLIEAHRRRRVGEAIVGGYRDTPQTEADTEWIDAATVAMILEEPW